MVYSPYANSAKCARVSLECNQSNLNVHRLFASPLTPLVFTPRLVLPVPVHRNLKQLSSQFRDIAAQSSQPGLDAFNSLRAERTLSRVKVHACGREERLGKVRHHPTIPCTFFFTISKYLPLTTRNHEPPFAPPTVCHARRAGLHRSAGVWDVEGFIDAVDGFGGRGR
jgi:hypothetical protein